MGHIYTGDGKGGVKTIAITSSVQNAGDPNAAIKARERPEPKDPKKKPGDKSPISR